MEDSSGEEEEGDDHSDSEGEEERWRLLNKS